MCVATVDDKGSLTLRLRLPDCIGEQHDKYLVVTGVRFRYSHEQVLAALESNAEYAAFRRRQREKAARQSGLVRHSAADSSGTGRAGGCSLPPT